MAADLAYRSYVSSKMLDTFLDGIPEVSQKHIDDLHKKDAWKNFIAKCTGGEKSGSLIHNSSDPNEKEFRELVQCIARLDGLGKYFGQRDAVRISHQGNHKMTTWNTDAKWLEGNHGSTDRQKELKPDLMSIVVEDVEEERPRQARLIYIQLTIL